jgi:putative tryptophan/tyrosine transport system substrate-binding protein
LEARTKNEIDDAFRKLIDSGVNALVVSSDAVFVNNRKQLTKLTSRDAVPAIYEDRRFVLDGGLVSYGPSSEDLFRQSGNYVGRILNGAKPEDLPVVLPTKFELCINLKTVKALGITVPQSILARADEVIE